MGGGAGHDHIRQGTHRTGRGDVQAAHFAAPAGTYFVIMAHTHLCLGILIGQGAGVGQQHPLLALQTEDLVKLGTLHRLPADDIAGVMALGTGDGHIGKTCRPGLRGQGECQHQYPKSQQE